MQNRCGFEGKGEIWVGDILNLGVSWVIVDLIFLCTHICSTMNIVWKQEWSFIVFYTLNSYGKQTIHSCQIFCYLCPLPCEIGLVLLLMTLIWLAYQTCEAYRNCEEAFYFPRWSHLWGVQCVQYLHIWKCGSEFTDTWKVLYCLLIDIFKTST